MSSVEIRQLIDDLAAARPPKPLLNQYRKSCKSDLYPAEGAELRRERLFQHMSCQPRLILLSGHADHSTQSTGIALTSEELITQGLVPRVMDEQITNMQIAQSSWIVRVIWDELARAKLDDKVIIWNAQPFFGRRPRDPEDRDEEREVDFGLPFLESLIKEFNGVPIVARTSAARYALERLGIKPAAIMPPLIDEQQGGMAVRKALDYFRLLPRNARTRNAGKSVRDFFASCRDKPATTDDEDAT